MNKTEKEDEKKQAEYLADAYFAAKGTEFFCWYMYQDDDEGRKPWGLVKSDRTTKKKSYLAFKNPEEWKTDRTWLDRLLCWRDRLCCRIREILSV